MEMLEKAAEKLAQYSKPEYNILKVIEECAELSEVMAKYLTKPSELKPSSEKLTEEMGDVIFRIFVAAKVLGVEQEVTSRVDEKAEIMLDWAINKYENKNV